MSRSKSDQRWGARTREPARQQPRPTDCGSQTRAPTFSATRNPGAGEGFTDLAAAVKLRLRAALGLQALQRCSGLLNRRARGGTVATHQISDVERRLS